MAAVDRLGVAKKLQIPGALKLVTQVVLNYMMLAASSLTHSKGTVLMPVRTGVHLEKMPTVEIPELESFFLVSYE